MVQSTPPPTEEPRLQLRNVSLTYPGGTKALDAVDMTLPDGDFLSLIGPSGCGKSTVLRLAAGLLPPSSGEVVASGVPAEQARRTFKDVSFVFQQPTLLPWRSVSHNVRLPLELQRVPRPEANRRVAELLEFVGLADFARHYPAQLSGGMQMRVSLARALVTKPRLLLLDEPFAALDDITRQRLNEELLTLWQRERFTALFVTHNVSEALFLSQRIAVLSARPGRVLSTTAVPFPMPRAAELRAEPEFAHLAGALGAELRRAHP